MSPSDRCTVALVDPVWVGHHATYFRAFIESFLEAGARVVALCPKPEDMEDMAREHPDSLSISKLEDAGVSLVRPLILRKRSVGGAWTSCSLPGLIAI